MRNTERKGHERGVYQEEAIGDVTWISWKHVTFSTLEALKSGSLAHKSKIPCLKIPLVLGRNKNVEQ